MTGNTSGASQKSRHSKDPKTQKLLNMKSGVEDSSLDSDDLRISGDEELLDELNGSLSSSEFAEEIKEKVKNHFKETKSYSS